MGVKAGKAGVPRGGPPSPAAYFVAMAGILGLLLLLCCYYCYFFFSKVKELSQQEPSSQTAAPRPTNATAYPVQPGVRDGATAMARLCRQSAGAATVFPALSPPATRAA